MSDGDDTFFDRADAHIFLSNDQLQSVSKGKVSASTLYGTARFNAWLSATGWNNAEEMKNAKDETLEYFVTEYRKMLEENLNDYIENFETYMTPQE